MEPTVQQPVSSESKPTPKPKSIKAGVILTILVGIILILATAFGVYTWQQGKVSNLDSKVSTLQKEVSDLNKKNASSAKTETVTQPAETNASSSITIKEWGVQIKLRDAAKVTYSYSGTAGDEFYIGKYDSSATPVIKPEFLQDKTCKVGVSLFRSKEKSDTFTQKKIGEYYFWVTGGPGACSDNPDQNPDDQLKSRILQDFSIQNLSAI